MKITSDVHVNLDGAVDLADAVALLSYLFAQGALPDPQEADCSGHEELG